MTTPQYEHPLPILESDTNSLSATPGHGGSFTIINTGGGQLSGHILSRLDGLVFTPSRIEGNNQVISYSYTPPENSTPPQSTTSQHNNNNNTQATHTQSVAYITTNGGEITLPITVSHSPMTIQTDEGVPISSVSDFYAYANSYPGAARRLFTTSEFYMLLLSTGYEYLPIYESLHKDTNRERAMDNFFQLSGKKTKTTLSLETKRIDITQKPGQISRATFYVQKSNSGYADAPITIRGDAPWLGLSTTRLATGDFDTNNRAKVDIKIDPLHLPGTFLREHIMVGRDPIVDNILELNIRHAAPFNLRLNRAGYRFDDRGTIEIENNTGYDMTVDLYSRDRFVRFYANSYVVGQNYSIQFEIRPGAFTSGFFRKTPYVSTSVDVRAHCPGQVFQRRLHFTIGEW